MLHRIVTLVSIAIAVGSLSLWAVEKHGGHKPGMDHSAMAGGTPEEGGQGAFAALVEIVGILEADSSTDWQKVDIDGLREHLIDMNHLMLGTTASQSVGSEGRILFDVQGTQASIPAIHRMVLAHSKFIADSRGWYIDVVINEYGATASIAVDDEAAATKLSALGFYGFMSLDSHHQAHHYQMALGHSH